MLVNARKIPGCCRQSFSSELFVVQHITNGKPGIHRAKITPIDKIPGGLPVNLKVNEF